jgi:hypothetical protein
MSGTLHGQSWAHLLGLGLLAPKEQLLSHIKQEVAVNCAYDKSGNCFLGQQTLPQAAVAGDLSSHSWVLDGSPSMNFDNAANAMWCAAQATTRSMFAECWAEKVWPCVHRVAGASFDDPLTVGAKAVVNIYHTSMNNDIWDWKDLHIGPLGKQCGTTDMPQGAALAGQPFVNAHYARQLQGWMVQRAASGQFYDAAGQRLELKPPAAHSGRGARIPWFTRKAAGLLIVGGTDHQSPHILLVKLGEVRPLSFWTE